MRPDKVRCIAVGKGGLRAWLFYEGDKRAYLGQSKLMSDSNTWAQDYLMTMKPRENRRFLGPVEIYVVRGRQKGSLLVHRVVGSEGMILPKKQSRLDL